MTSLNEEYQMLVARCFRGRHVAPRGEKTYESNFPDRIIFRPGETLTRPKFAPLLGIVEGLSMVAGGFYPEAIRAAAPGADPNLFDLRGSYGPRIIRSTFKVVDELVRDPFSRRAVAYIAGVIDGDSGHPSLPCTQHIQFLIRDNKLHANIAMRSWDMAWGLPYDVIQFGLLQLVMMQALRWSFGGLDTGYTTVTAGSAHIYQKTASLVDVTKQGPTFFLHPVNILLSPRWSDYVGWARSELFKIARGKKLDDIGWLVWEETE